MTPSDLHAAGEALYGQQWQSSLARDLDMSDRHMRRLAAGLSPISDALAKEIEGLIRQRIQKLEKLVA